VFARIPVLTRLSRSCCAKGVEARGRIVVEDVALFSYAPEDLEG
jgi:hypothetical protein